MLDPNEMLFKERIRELRREFAEDNRVNVARMQRKKNA